MLMRRYLPSDTTVSDQNQKPNRPDTSNVSFSSRVPREQSRAELLLPALNSNLTALFVSEFTVDKHHGEQRTGALVLGPRQAVVGDDERSSQLLDWMSSFVAVGFALFHRTVGEKTACVTASEHGSSLCSH
jgi:hypothetical protein